MNPNNRDPLQNPIGTSRFSAMQEEITRLAMRIAFVFAGVILLVTALPSVLAGAAAWAVERYNLGANRFEMWVFSAPIIALVLGVTFVLTFGPRSRKNTAKRVEQRGTPGHLTLVQSRQQTEEAALERDVIQSELLREGIELAVRYARLRNERKQEERLRAQQAFERGYPREREPEQEEPGRKAA